MNDKYYDELKRCKTNWLDDIFYGTKESKGLRNAVNAMKLVLFDDFSVVPDGVEINDKYEFISSRNDGRAKAKMFQKIDIIHILCHYALCSFGLMNKDFSVDKATYLIYRNQGITNQGYSNEYIIELVAYSLMDDIYGGYLFICANKFIVDQLFDAFVKERYLEGRVTDLDLFNGELTNNIIPLDIKEKYQYTFDILDDVFLRIKKKDNDYINK